KVIILILWWRNFQLEYWRNFQLVSTHKSGKIWNTYCQQEHKKIPTGLTASPDIIHKSQDVSDGNLTNSKIQRLLRAAYAMPNSVSSCKFLYWALSEPPSEIA
ncbi:hypothetical protein KSU69_04205, partial [Phocaeicola vulgatus]